MRQEDVSQWVKDAQVAFGAATDLDSLKAARLAHAGDKAPISLASRTLGSLSPEEKASFGKIIGDGKAAIVEALAQATQKLEAVGSCPCGRCSTYGLPRHERLKRELSWRRRVACISYVRVQWSRLGWRPASRLLSFAFFLRGAECVISLSLQPPARADQRSCTSMPRSL